MAEYWVSTLRPDDTGSGLSYATAKKTIAAAIPLATTKNDIINIANDGNHQWTVSANGTSLPVGSKGTSFTDFGTLIRGTTSAGAPALTTIEAKAADGNVARTLVRIPHDAGYLLLRNLVFNSTPSQTNTTTHKVVTWHDDGAPGPGPYRFEGCVFIGAALGVAPGGSRIASSVSTGGAAGVDYAHFVGCFIQNHVGNFVDGTNPAAVMQKTFDHCVIYQDWTALVTPNERLFNLGNVLSASNVTGVTNCHFYEVIGNNLFVPLFDYNVTGGNVGLYDNYNNLSFTDSTNADPDIIFMGGGGSGTVTRTGTIDYNVILGGPNTAAGDFHDTQGMYEAPFDEGVDPKANDITGFSLAEATVFNAPGSTYAWDPLGNGITITLPKDLRLKAPYDALGLGGILRGALPGLGIDMAVDIATSNATPFPLETFTITVTASCTGAVGTGVTYTAKIPAGIQFLSAIPQVGSYTVGDGLWSVGTLTPGFPRTLQLIVRPLAYTELFAITFFASVTAFTPPTDTNLANNTDSVTVMVSTLEKILSPEISDEKILAPETSNEKVLVAVASTEKVVLP